MTDIGLDKKINRLTVLADLSETQLTELEIENVSNDLTSLEKAIVCVALYWYKHIEEYKKIKGTRTPFAKFVLNEALGTLGLRDTNIVFKDNMPSIYSKPSGYILEAVVGGMFYKEKFRLSNGMRYRNEYDFEVIVEVGDATFKTIRMETRTDLWLYDQAEKGRIELIMQVEMVVMRRYLFLVKGTGGLFRIDDLIG